MTDLHASDPAPDDASTASSEARPDVSAGGPASTPSAVTLEDRVRALAEQAAEDSGLYVVGVVVRGHPGSRVVEVFADGGGIDELAGLSRRLSFLLDTEDPVSGHYRLDVSTPGADRPLSDVRQYPQHVGRTLRVTMADASGTGAVVTGVLVEATPEAVTVQPEGGEPVVVPVAALREAVVVLPW